MDPASLHTLADKVLHGGQEDWHSAFSKKQGNPAPGRLPRRTRPMEMRLGAGPHHRSP
jgi:hypothetical protein